MSHKHCSTKYLTLQRNMRPQVMCDSTYRFTIPLREGVYHFKVCFLPTDFHCKMYFRPAALHCLRALRPSVYHCITWKWSEIRGGGGGAGTPLNWTTQYDIHVEIYMVRDHLDLYSSEKRWFIRKTSFRVIFEPICGQTDRCCFDMGIYEMSAPMKVIWYSCQSIPL